MAYLQRVVSTRVVLRSAPSIRQLFLNSPAASSSSSSSSSSLAASSSFQPTRVDDDDGGLGEAMVCVRHSTLGPSFDVWLARTVVPRSSETLVVPDSSSAAAASSNEHAFLSHLVSGLTNFPTHRTHVLGLVQATLASAPSLCTALTPDAAHGLIQSAMMTVSTAFALHSLSIASVSNDESAKNSALAVLLLLLRHAVPSVRQQVRTTLRTWWSGLVSQSGNGDEPLLANFVHQFAVPTIADSMFGVHEPVSTSATAAARVGAATSTASASSSTRATASAQAPCKYGSACYRTSNPDHMRQYSHPSDVKNSTTATTARQSTSRDGGCPDCEMSWEDVDHSTCSKEVDSVSAAASSAAGSNLRQTSTFKSLQSTPETASTGRSVSTSTGPVADLRVSLVRLQTGVSVAMDASPASCSPFGFLAGDVVQVSSGSTSTLHTVVGVHNHELYFRFTDTDHDQGAFSCGPAQASQFAAMGYSLVRHGDSDAAQTEKRRESGLLQDFSSLHPARALARAVAPTAAAHILSNKRLAPVLRKLLSFLVDNRLVSSSTQQYSELSFATWELLSVCSPLLRYVCVQFCSADNHCRVCLWIAGCAVA
jgi:hypothetical protein